MRSSLSPAFQSLQGFHRFVPAGDPVREQIGELYERSLQDDGGFRREGCNSVRLLDTFFGFPEFVFTSMINDLSSKKQDFDVQILLVNPHSQLARSRAQALAEAVPGDSEDPFFRSSKRLHTMTKDVCAATGSEREPRFPSPDDGKPVEIFRELLDTFREETTELPIEIKFYDRPTEAPVYIVSEFIAKGLLLDNRGADRNPWMILVDDPNQANDLYDRLSANFDGIWQSAAASPTGYRVVGKVDDAKRSVFIIMKMDEEDERSTAVYKTIKKVWKSFDIDALRADDHQGDEKRITDVMMNALTNADYVICDLSGNRPNVYYEAGYAQALGKPVLFVVDSDTEVHFDLRDYPITTYADADDLKKRLKPRIQRLLEERTLHEPAPSPT